MPELLRGFLSPDEVTSLRALANTPTGWVTGRQNTGYDTLPLRDVLADHAAVSRALAKIGTPFEQYWDVYIIRYVDGTHVPAHVDAAQHGHRHRRLNAVLALPRSGGDLFIDHAPIVLGVGDAVLFDPDRETHSVTPVGTRLLFSVGAWV